MRTPRLNDIVKTHKLRKKGKTYSEISWAVLNREDRKQIYRWLKIDVGSILKKLSTPNA